MISRLISAFFYDILPNIKLEGAKNRLRVRKLVEKKCSSLYFKWYLGSLVLISSEKLSGQIFCILQTFKSIFVKF